MSVWYDEMGNTKQCYYLVSFLENDDCYDELHFYPGDEARVFKYIGYDDIKVEAVFMNGDVYELSAKLTRNWMDEHKGENGE